MPPPGKETEAGGVAAARRGPARSSCAGPGGGFLAQGGRVTGARGGGEQGAREQTNPLLVHRTPILYLSQLAHNDIQENSTNEE